MCFKKSLKERCREKDNAVAPSSSQLKPRSTTLSRLVHEHYPPPPPRHGPCSLIGTGDDPQGIKALLYRHFPPTPQTDVPWYSPRLDARAKIFEAVFSSYIHLEHEELLEHIHSIRDRAWSLAPYPFLGQGWFLLPSLSKLASWPELVAAGKSGKTIVDLGCGLGQNLRQLHIEAGETQNLYAIDSRREMWQLSCELFRDVEKPVAKFIRTDARLQYGSGLNTGRLTEIQGSVDIIMISDFLDIFDWYGQKDIGNTIALLSRVGTKVMGRCLGTVFEKTTEYKKDSDLSPRMYHSPDSFRDLWIDIGASTKTSWKVEAKEVDLEEWGYSVEDLGCMSQPEPKGLHFVVVREN